MLVSQSLLEHGAVRLDDYKIPAFNSDRPPEPTPDYKPYQLHRKGGHAHYYFPLGSSVLSVPYVAVIKLIGVSPVTADGVFDFWGEAKIECSLAALLMALLAVVFYCTARILLPAWSSFAIALAGAFGTQVWTTASRGLWADTWGILLLGIALFILLDQEIRRSVERPIALATLLAWMYFVRPTYCVPIVAISTYLFFAPRPRDFAKFALTGAAWFAGFVYFSWYQFDQWLPDYYFANRLTFTSFGTALAGNLISPSRGLLIFVPATLFVGYLLLRYRRNLPCPRLVIASLATIPVHLVLVAGFSPWYGGHCYGPRYTTGLVPWFVLLAILGTRAALDWRMAHAGAREFRVKAEAFAAWSLVLLGVAIHGNGALNHHTTEWNIKPVNVDAHPERVWDWHDPQFLVGWSR